MVKLVQLLLGAISAVNAVNFPYELVQLAESDIQSFPAVAFGNVSAASPVSKEPRCKVAPGDEGWPTDSEWQAFNKTLGGKLLKPLPLGSVCYPGPNYSKEKCEFVSGPAGNTRFFLDDPLNVMTSWAEGNSCPPAVNATGTCDQGGFPVYVVNATTVKDIQAAVNFARNKKLRLNIKNTGHDFIGRSSGRGSLSIWVHYMKNIEYLKNYSIGEYKGSAARVSVGTEAFEAQNAMSAGNYTLVVTGAPTVSVIGGWAMGGGHSSLTSLYGLGSDQLLSVNIVTADGKFITADLNQSQDLFFATRGGGPGTYGVVTSAIVKAYPGSLNFSGASYSLAVGPTPPGNLSTLSPVKPTTPTVIIPNVETFWSAFNLYMSFVPNVTAVGGMGFGDLSNPGNDSFTFISSFIFPGKSISEATTLVRPFFASLRALGVNITDPPALSVPYAQPAYKGSEDSGPNNKVFSSRLFPRANWANATLFNLTTATIRRAVQDGHLNYRCRNFHASTAAGGYLADAKNSGANPAFRDSLMHSSVFQPELADRETTTAEQFRGRNSNLKKHMDELRALTPGSGAYINEAEVTEPNFGQSFFGTHYARLLGIKRAVDPWNLFWAPSTVGSEGWAVTTADGLPTQNGPLCRVGSQE